jgi:hypothetical protein
MGTDMLFNRANRSGSENSIGELRAPAVADIPEAQKISQEDLARFASTMQEIAAALGDLKKPLALTKSGQRFTEEAKYSYCWSEFKHMLGDSEGQQAVAKGILRSQGCEGPFLDALRTIVNAGLPAEYRQQEARIKRFAVALRLAVHLSPGNADKVYQEMDALTDVRRTGCPLKFVHAYQSFKARDNES